MEKDELESQLAKAVKECKSYQKDGYELENPIVKEFLTNWQISTTGKNSDEMLFKVGVRLSRKLESGIFSDFCDISGFAKEEDGKISIVPPIKVTNHY